MQMGNLQITAPALGAPGYNEAAVFGSVTWLWMHVADHQDLPLKALTLLLLPPLKNRQYMLASAPDGNGDDIRPVAYVAWANLSAEAESRYLANPAVGLRPEDWASGDRMWLIDWFTPFGHAPAFRRAVGQLLADSCARALYHRGNERGMRVLTFRGDHISEAQSRQWWQARPMLASPSFS